MIYDHKISNLNQTSLRKNAFNKQFLVLVHYAHHNTCANVRCTEIKDKVKFFFYYFHILTDREFQGDQEYMLPVFS